MTALLYLHFASVSILMLLDATLAMTFNKKFRPFKSLVKRTLWPVYAVFYLVAAYLITNGNKKAGERVQRMRW